MPARMITSADIQWLGCFKIPCTLGSNSSSFTGNRRAANGGRLTFFSLDDNQEMVEYDYPGYGTSPATAPRAGVFDPVWQNGGDGPNPLTKRWGDPTTTTNRPPSESKKQDDSGRVNGSPEPNLIIHGLFFDPTQNALFWMYNTPYTEGRYDDPHIGAAVLNDATGQLTAYGPWRTSFQGSPGTTVMSHHMLLAPVAFANQYLGGQRQLFGSDWYGGLSRNYGPTLHSPVSAIVPATTPVYTQATPHDIPTVDLIHYVWTGFSEVQPTSGPGQPVGVCTGTPATMMGPDKTSLPPRSGNYIIHPDDNAVPAIGDQRAPDSYGTGLTGYPGWFDGSDGASQHSGTAWLWIDTPTRFGVLQFVYLGQGHVDYTPGTPCCHNVNLHSLCTGPMAETAQSPVVYFYDPAIFADVLQNHPLVTLSDGNAYPKTWRAPSEVKDMSAAGFISRWNENGLGPITPDDNGHPDYPGAYYDDQLGLGFVMAQGAEIVNGSPFAVVNVFRVN